MQKKQLLLLLSILWFACSIYAQISPVAPTQGFSTMVEGNATLIDNIIQGVANQNNPSINIGSISNVSEIAVTVWIPKNTTNSDQNCPTMLEICNNGLDDDGDGLVDCEDCEDCASACTVYDWDSDGINNFCDLDDDNDGIPDL